MKITRQTETSVFIEAINQNSIARALSAAGLAPTDDFDIRPAQDLRTTTSDEGDIMVPVSGFELVHCNVEIEHVADEEQE